MSIGLGILLVAIGAVLTFALNVTVDWIDLDLVGYILMIAGAIVIILGLIFMMRRRRSISTTSTTADPVAGQRVTRTEDQVTPPEV
jgi:cytochrome c biogenesis protein CcdA